MSADPDATEFVDGVAAAAAYAGIAAPRVKIQPRERANAEAKSKRLILVGPDLLRNAPSGVQRWVAAHEVGHIVGGHVRPTRYFPYAGAGLIALIGVGLGFAGMTVGAVVACAGTVGVLFAVDRSVRIGRPREAEADTFANAIVSLSPADVRFLLGDDWATPSFLRKHRPHAERLIFDRADDADLVALRQEVGAVRAELNLPRAPLVVFSDSASRAIATTHGELQLCPSRLPTDRTARRQLFAAGLLEASHPTPSGFLVGCVVVPAAVGASVLGYSHPWWAVMVYALVILVGVLYGGAELLLRSRDRRAMRLLENAHASSSSSGKKGDLTA